MTHSEAAKLAQAKLSTVNINTLKEAAIKLSDVLTTEADFALDQILDNLMNRMESDDFIAFCDTL